MPQEPMLYVLLGAAIALVGSVLATWVQGTLTRRATAREKTQAAVHELWRLFIDEREAGESAGGITAGRGLGEAELLTATITDRRVRERVTVVLRLLRVSALPEMAELSGIPAPQARQELCAHVLEVLGTQLRNERLPALPESVQTLTRVESEALKIHAGGAAPRAVASEPTPAAKDKDKGRHKAGDKGGETGDTGEDASPTPAVARSSVRRRPRTTKPDASTATDSAEDNTPEPSPRPKNRA